MKIKITELETKAEIESTDLVMVTDPETGLSTTVQVARLQTGFNIPEVGSITPTHVMIVSINGINYKIPCALEDPIETLSFNDDNNSFYIGVL